MSTMNNEKNAKGEWFIEDDDPNTITLTKQKHVEELVSEKFEPYEEKHGIRELCIEDVLLERQKHIDYVSRGLLKLSRGMQALDASKPWLLYWILHSLDLLGQELPPEMINRGVTTASKWQHPQGGFGGGPDQLAHLATTYAAVHALAILGTKEAYDVIDRELLYKFLLRMKQEDGSFTMHEGGEIDIRGSYCALSVAALTNLLTPELTKNVAEFISRAQTYEGGIGPYPGKESHNGYTFCGLAAMEILGSMDKLDVDKLTAWCTGRQMAYEGGFQGRTNKLVDGCYSFWGAGDFPLISAEIKRQTGQDVDYLFDRKSLQKYILLCCQDDIGGLVDKPETGPDYYHTCYVLSGLSTAQHHALYDTEAADRVRERGLDPSRGGIGSLLWKFKKPALVLGDPSNQIQPTHPIHNVSVDKARTMIHYFYPEAKQVLDVLPKDE